VAPFAWVESSTWVESHTSICGGCLGRDLDRDWKLFGAAATVVMRKLSVIKSESFRAGAVGQVFLQGPGRYLVSACLCRLSPQTSISVRVKTPHRPLWIRQLA
jgi:hypothetical protein